MDKKKILSIIAGVVVVLVGLFFGVNINSKDGKITTPNGKEFVGLPGQQGFTTNNMLGMLNANNYTVYVTKSGKKYHTENCRYVLGKKISLTRQEAIDEGYTPCKRCKPDENTGIWQPQPPTGTKTPQQTDKPTEKQSEKKTDRNNQDDIILE
jgi:hypothetical protein